MRAAPSWVFLTLILTAALAQAQGDPRPDRLGTVENGRYRHLLTNVQFAVPPGWRVSRTYPSTDDGQGVQLYDGRANAVVSLWMMPEQSSPQQIQERLSGAVDRKTGQRLSGDPRYTIAGADMRTYRIREDSVTRILVDGHSAVQRMADYRVDDVPMVEVMTSVVSPNTRLLVTGRVPAGDLDSVLPVYRTLLGSISVP